MSVTDPARETIIRVDSVSKAFKLPHEKQTSVKSLFVGIFRGRRSYERQRVLKNVTFEIKKGEFFGIVGRNGSGKSTLLKLLAGIYSPDEGAILINGKLTPFIELGVGFNPELTGRENVYLNGALLGFNRREVNAMYDEIVEFAELKKFMDQKLKNYSSGMQVRLAFSIAIRAKSDILLLDEVLAVGDAAFQQKCYNYFEALKQQGQTVVFVSHDMGAIKRFCTSAVYIANGKITHQGTASEIADVYTMRNIEKAGRDDAEQRTVSREHTVTSKISEPAADTLLLRVSYTSKDDEELYIGMSIMKDSISIAEITTAPQKPLKGQGAVTYKLDTSIFNAGVYEIGVGLFRMESKKLIALSPNRHTFGLTRNDSTRGSALKLADTWTYE